MITCELAGSNSLRIGSDYRPLQTIDSCRLFNSERKLNLSDQTIKIYRTGWSPAMSWENAFSEQMLQSKCLRSFQGLKSKWSLKSCPAKRSNKVLSRSIWQNCFSVFSQFSEPSSGSRDSRNSHRIPHSSPNTNRSNSNSQSNSLTEILTAARTATTSGRDTFGRKPVRSG